MAKKPVTVGVRPIGDGIEIRFKLDGKTLRPRLRIEPTKANLLHAHKHREKVLAAIAHGEFRMADFFPDYRMTEEHDQVDEERTFNDWADVWEKLAARTIDASTLRAYKSNLRSHWRPVFGPRYPKAITNEQILERMAELSTGWKADPAKNVNAQKPLSRKTQNNTLVPLRAVWDLISKAPGAGPNPMDGIENLQIQTGNPDPFTLEETEIALAEVRKRFSEVYADYFEFAAFAGLRNSEQIALLWPDVDLRIGTVFIHRSKVETKEKERTKTKRARTVELNDRALAVLKRQRARTQAAGAEVFWNPDTRKPWNDEQVQWRVWSLSLRATGIRYRPPKELRDTSVTLALAAGCDPYWVAAQHGHSVTTMMKDYAKWIPKADRGRNRDAMNRSLGTDQAREASNDE